MSNAHQTQHRHPLAHLGLAVVFCLFATGCSGVSCSGPGYELGTTETLPDNAYIEPALELRVTQEGGQFLSESGPEVLKGLLGEADGDWIDASDVLNQFIGDLSLFGLAAGDVVAAVRLPNPDGLLIEFRGNPTRVHVEIDELHLRLEATVTSGDAACRVRGDVASGVDRRMFTLRNLSLDIELATDTQGNFDITTNVLNVDIIDSGIEVVTDSSDPDYYCNLEQCASCATCDSLCRTAGFADDVGNFFVEAFDSFVGSLAELVVNAVLAQVQQVGGRLHPALLLGSLLQDVYDSEMLTFGARGTRDAFAFVSRPDLPGETGDLDVRLALGVVTSEIHPCVQPLSVDPAFRSTPSPPLMVPAGADMGVGVPDGFVDQLLWALYASGALCLDIDSSTIRDLTSDTLDLNVGLLSLLLPGLDELAPKDAALVLAIKPRLEASDFPLVQLGEGEGGLIQVVLPEVEVGIYAEVDEQLIQLLAVSVAIDVGITPIATPDGGLALGIERLEVTDIQESYDELFVGVELDAILGFVVEVLGRALIGREIPLPFTLDALIGGLFGVPLAIEVLEISSTGTGWLAMSVGLGQSGAPLWLQAETRLLEPPPRSMVATDALRLALDPGLEVQWSIDHLAWSGFHQGPEVVVQTHLLQLPGRHHVELRAREVGKFRTLDPTPLEFDIEVTEQPLEAVPPHADTSAEPTGGCSQTGTGSAPAPVWMLMLMVFGLFWRRVPTLQVTAMICAAALLIGCGDDSQNDELQCEGDRDCPNGQLCGCDGTCAFPTRCATNADCCGGRSCVDGQCDARFECREDTDCKAGLACQDCQCQRLSCGDDGVCGIDVCVDGLCRAPEGIPCDGACEENEVCIAERDVCVWRQNICPDAACAPGEQLLLENASGLLGEQCSFDDLRCACRASPALPTARPGGWVAVVADGTTFTVAAYEAHYGDLVTLEGTPEQGLGNVTFLDGVPDTRPTSDPAGPRGGIGARGPDVGRYASAARRADGVLLVASYDATNGALRLVERDGTNTTALTLDADADAGRFSDLAVFPDGRPVLAYQVADLDESGAGRISLRIATARTQLFTSAQDFQISEVDGVVVEGSAQVCGGMCAADEVCLAEDDTCARPLPASACEASCALGTECIDGTCRTIRPSSDANITRRGTGVEPDVVPLGNFEVAVVYYRPASGELAGAIGTDTGPFRVEVLDAGTTRAGFGDADVGRSPAAVADTAGLVHIAYVDQVSGSLLYTAWDTTTGMTQPPVVVRDGLAANPTQRIGGIDIALMGDTIYIVYQDASAGTLNAAERQLLSDTWTNRVIDDTDVSGFSPSLAAEGNTLVAAHGRLKRSGRGDLLRSIGLVRVR